MVGQISHDLRTPLNSITVLLNLAVAFRGIPKIFTEEYIKPALTNCNLLMSLINDILDFTKEDFNQDNEDPNMSYEPVSIRKQVEQISLGFLKRAEIRGIDFQYEIDERIPTQFNTDSQRLNQILNNLVGNSMKFTFQGFVKIKADLVLRKKRGKKGRIIGQGTGVQFSIIDTGLGIKSEEQKNLFQLFSTLDTTKNINKSGTGIGLYQSQKFAKKLGFA